MDSPIRLTTAPRPSCIPSGSLKNRSYHLPQKITEATSRNLSPRIQRLAKHDSAYLTTPRTLASRVAHPIAASEKYLHKQSTFAISRSGSGSPHFASSPGLSLNRLRIKTQTSSNASTIPTRPRSATTQVGTAYILIKTRRILSTNESKDSSSSDLSSLSSGVSALILHQSSSEISSVSADPMKIGYPSDDNNTKQILPVFECHHVTLHRSCPKDSFCHRQTAQPTKDDLGQDFEFKPSLKQFKYQNPIVQKDLHALRAQRRVTSLMKNFEEIV